jgi:hypothetical protein
MMKEQNISTKVLNRIVIIEFTKTLYTKSDEENKEGHNLQRLINRMVAIVNEINLIILLQKFDFNHCKGSLHQHFKNTINYY